MRRFSFGACWLLSALTIGTITNGVLQHLADRRDRQAAAHERRDAHVVVGGLAHHVDHARDAGMIRRAIAAG